MAIEYTNDIIINLPRQKVVDLIDNPDNMVHWQQGFLGMDHISGEQGQEGAKYNMRYKVNGREMEMVETILKRNFPDEFNATYEAKGVFNRQLNRFEEVDGNTTKWISESYFEFKGFMKLMGWLMPGMFKKQSMKYLNDFKSFAEDGKSV